MPRNSFRDLNANEEHMLEKLFGIQNLISDTEKTITFVDWKLLTVSYESFSGGFTVCLVRYYITLDGHEAVFIWRGVSRCAYDDKYNRTKAEALAFKRAIINSWPVEI